MAKKCPACGLAFEKTKKKSHWGKILGGIVLLIVIGAIYGNSDSTHKTPSRSLAQPDYVVSPQQIVAEYQANEIAADYKI